MSDEGDVSAYVTGGQNRSLWCQLPTPGYFSPILYFKNLEARDGQKIVRNSQGWASNCPPLPPNPKTAPDVRYGYNKHLMLAYEVMAILGSFFLLSVSLSALKRRMFREMSIGNLNY